MGYGVQEGGRMNLAFGFTVRSRRIEGEKPAYLPTLFNQGQEISLFTEFNKVRS